MTHIATAGSAAQSAQVRTATASDKDNIIETIVLAFATDPVVRWVFPDDDGYHRHFPSFATAFGGGAIPGATAYLSESGAGAALWFAPGDGPDEDAMTGVMENSVPAERMELIGNLFEGLDSFHPQEAHWYLPLIGVRPDRQGEGHGSALLSHVLGLCDASNLPSYLEATSERNFALYKRHGFEPLGEIRVPGCPVLTPMLRAARGR